jgi:hypothetical protein
MLECNAGQDELIALVCLHEQAKSSVKSCQNFKETASVIAKVSPISPWDDGHEIWLKLHSYSSSSVVRVSLPLATNHTSSRLQQHFLNHSHREQTRLRCSRLHSRYFHLPSIFFELDNDTGHQPSFFVTDILFRVSYRATLQFIGGLENVFGHIWRRFVICFCAAPFSRVCAYFLIRSEILRPGPPPLRLKTDVDLDISRLVCSGIESRRCKTVQYCIQRQST